jgi:hypothetical protein
VAIEWQRVHYGPGWRGFDGRLFVAQVEHYDVPEPHWRAFSRCQRVNGPFDDAEAAQRAAVAVYVPA